MTVPLLALYVLFVIGLPLLRGPKEESVFFIALLE